MNINGKELSEEIVAKAMECKSSEELMELAKAEGLELTKDEAEAYLAEMEDVELTDDELQQVAGGKDGCLAEKLCWIEGGLTSFGRDK